METATRPRPLPDAAPPAPGRVRRLLLAAAGPALIVVSVLIALRGFAFLPRLTNQHPDLLSFWLPRSCLLGEALAQGRVPLWNPFEMAGTPFAADAQSGWLSITTMLTSWLLGCGDGLRAQIVLQPIVAGLGLWWFLRREGLGRLAATAGGLSLAMAMAASIIAISLPFAGTLAWTPLVLVGAQGVFSASGWRRLGWLALAAVAWGQVAAAHLSHGLLMCTALVTAYVVARALRGVRSGTVERRRAVLLALGFLAFLPLANLAIFLPRFALLERSSLAAGYGALEGTVAGSIGLDRPIPTEGVWSAWPLALASTPGAYVGAAILLALPLALRDRTRRHLAVAFGGLLGLAYLLTLSILVGAGWFRSFVLALPYGDVYLHNPGRLRYLAFLVVPVLGAIGLQALLDLRPGLREALRWIAPALGLFLLLPLAVGANPRRLAVFAIGSAAVVGALWARPRLPRIVPVSLVGVLAVELLAGALWSSAYRGGTVYFGLEPERGGPLVQGALRWPRVPLDRYLEPGPIAREIRGQPYGRYLAWVLPGASFNKGYLFTQAEADWPALLLGRAVLFRIHDALGYSPIQLPRYWTYIRATNRLPVFYNASVIQLPTIEDVRLLGVRYLIVHVGQDLPDGLAGEVVERERGYLLVGLEGWQPRASVVPSWTVVAGEADALERVLEPGFDPAREAVLEDEPGIRPTDPMPGTAVYREVRPEDVRIEVEAPAPSLVVVRNAWDRGWTATVDGRPAQVLRADHLLQAVPVAAGRHEVRLVYREPAIGRGLVASAAAWAGMVVGVSAVALVRRRRATRPPAPPPAAAARPR